jgi:hypothetical protein
MVHASSSPVAALALEQAIGIQGQAWENFNRNTTDGYKLALNLTEQARELAKRALVSSRSSEQGEAAVFNRLERAAELLRTAREEMPHDVDEAINSIFETARSNLSQAWEFYHNGQYRPAIKLSNQVEKTAQRLLQVAKRQQNFESNFQRRQEAARQFIQRIQDEIGNCSSVQAQELLTRAWESLRMSSQLSLNNQYELAVRQLQQSRKLAGEAADLCGRAADFSENLKQITLEAENLRERVQLNDENGQRLLDQIFGQLETAKSFIAQNDSEGASAALRASHLTIQQLQRYLTTGEL